MLETDLVANMGEKIGGAMEKGERDGEMDGK